MNPARQPLQRPGLARRPASRSPRSPPSWPSAIGCDEIPNDITRETLACFEPTIDYVVTKIPRWAFEKFPDADPTLTMQMKSVGETMAIGRTFKESLQKALRGLEIGHFGLGGGKKDRWGTPQAADDATKSAANWPCPTTSASGSSATRSRRACRSRRFTQLTEIDPWFLRNISRSGRNSRRSFAQVAPPRRRRGRVDCARPSGTASPTASWPRGGTQPRWRSAGDAQAAAASWRPSSRSTPAPPSSRPTRPTTTRPTKTRTKRPRKAAGRQRIMILGGGPNRIGQGIEFDYCCCHASFALQELGIESIMVNSNPETVSTDYDTSRLPVLRAADDRRRAQHLRPHAARRRDRAVRRADAAESGPRPGGGRRARSSAPAPT